MPNLKLTLLQGGVPLAANYQAPVFNSTALSGGVVVIDEISTPPTAGISFICIDEVLVELALPNPAWKKVFIVRHPGTAFRISEGSGVTIVFDDPANVLVVERTPASLRAMRDLIASIPMGPGQTG